MDDTTGRGINRGLIVALVSLVALLGCGILTWLGIGGTPVFVAFLMIQVVAISIAIWQACDPFAEAAQYIGLRFNIPGSIRGATLDAIASSLPELFSGIFFVVVAVFATDAAAEVRASDGFGAVVATCAGSAVYNMILIPAVCVLVISRARKERPTIDIAPTVIARDGMWFLACEMLLIVFLFMPAMNIWMALALIGAYVIYIARLISDARKFQKAIKAVRATTRQLTEPLTTSVVEQAFVTNSIPYNKSLVTEIRNRLIDQQESLDDDDQQEAPESAKAFFGLVNIRLGPRSCWAIIGVCALFAAACCYWLVEVTIATSEHLEVPLFFVALIIAAAASSIPDTFLSIGASLRGDDDGAVSNAFGSNIFDICICLSIPLIVGIYLNGGRPISLTQNGEPIPGLVGIRVLLCVLTVVTLLIMWHNLQLTKKKAWVLIGLYAVFVAYAVLGSLGIGIDKWFT